MPTHAHYLTRVPVHPADLVPGRWAVVRDVGRAEFVGRGDGGYHFAPPGPGYDGLVTVADDDFADDVYDLGMPATMPDVRPAGRRAG